MKKIRRNIGPATIQPNEHVVACIRPSWRYYIRYAIAPFCLNILLGVNLWQITAMLYTGIIILAILSRYSNVYIITTARVIEVTGIISKYTSQSCISHIQLIITEQSIIDRFLFVGNVKIESAAHNGERGDIVFGGVDNPINIKEKIFRLKYNSKKSRKNNNDNKRRKNYR